MLRVGIFKILQKPIFFLDPVVKLCVYVCLSVNKVKGKGKVRRRRGHEGLEVE